MPLKAPKGSLAVSEMQVVTQATAVPTGGQGHEPLSKEALAGSVKADSKHNLTAVSKQHVSATQCQTTLHESELRQVSAMAFVPMTMLLQHVVCMMASVCQAACNKVVSPDTMTAVKTCKHVMQLQQSVLGSAYHSQ